MFLYVFLRGIYSFSRLQRGGGTYISPLPGSLPFCLSCFVQCLMIHALSLCVPPDSSVLNSKGSCAEHTHTHTLSLISFICHLILESHLKVHSVAAVELFNYTRCEIAFVLNFLVLWPTAKRSSQKVSCVDLGSPSQITLWHCGLSRSPNINCSFKRFMGGKVSDTGWKSATEWTWSEIVLSVKRFSNWNLTQVFIY